ncbi:MAG: hypothetical protein NZ551_01095 [Microscillaceae bacterium]|nr:hypothetical protein [Microscillaceae bacterium]MDW8459785.1 hypothetical protein [Cytophagales bacterium]
MKNLHCILWGIVFIMLGSCKKSDTPIPEEEKILMSTTWKVEGFYINNTKQPNTPDLRLRFLGERAGVRPLIANGIPGSAWRLNGTQLIVFYPSAGIKLDPTSGIAPSVGSITLNVSKLTNTNLNLTQNTNENFFGIFQFSANAELRMIPE